MGYKGAGLYWKPDVLVCAASSLFCTQTKGLSAELIHFSRVRVSLPLVHLVLNVRWNHSDGVSKLYCNKESKFLPKHFNGTSKFEDMESDPTPLFTVYFSFVFFSHVLPHSSFFVCFLVFLLSNTLSTIVSLCVSPLHSFSSCHILTAFEGHSVMERCRSRPHTYTVRRPSKRLNEQCVFAAFRTGRICLQRQRELCIVLVMDSDFEVSHWKGSARTV